jgi:hypothetical protein
MDCDNAGPIPNVHPGFFRTSNMTAVACVPSIACLRTMDALNTECSTGYTGFLCSRCADNFHSSSGSCVLCPPLWVKAFTVVGIVIILLLIGYRLSNIKASIPSDARALIQAVQLLALFPRISAKWPSALLPLFSLVSLAVGNSHF